MFDFDHRCLLPDCCSGYRRACTASACVPASPRACISPPAWIPNGLRDLLATTLLINAGRISGYVIAGEIVGGVGSGVFGAFDHATSNAVLRWAAAAALG
jgi:sulfite exporter TauE/SafE